MRVQLNEFDREMEKLLNTYSRETAEVVKDVIQHSADFCVEQIEAKAPGDGDYASSWKAKKSYEDSFDVRYTCYSKKYQLVHLLEYGHDKWLWGKRTGGRVDPKPHVRPAVDATATQIINQLKVRL